jgi:hypothetical protein
VGKLECRKYLIQLSVLTTIYVENLSFLVSQIQNPLNFSIELIYVIFVEHKAGVRNFFPRQKKDKNGKKYLGKI